MGANRRKPYPQIAVERVKSAKLLEALQNHALRMPDSEMTPTQVQAARILLGKVIPDLKAIEHTGEGGGPVQNSVTVTYVDGKRTDPQGV